MNLEKFNGNLGGLIAGYILLNLAFTTFSGSKIKIYDMKNNIIVTKPRQINLGDLDDKVIPFLYAYKLKRNSEILFENGDRVELNSKINFLENCLCYNCLEKKEIKFEDILNYYEYSKNKTSKRITQDKFNELFLGLGSSFCDLKPKTSKIYRMGFIYNLRAY